MPAAIVTGSESGIGRATAAVLAERGYDVGITYLSDEEAARKTAAEVESHGRRAAIHQVDVSDPDAARAMVDALAEELGGLDLLVNNAGTGGGEPFLEMGFDTWRRVIDTNLTGAFAAAQRAAQRMIDAGRPGVIVNVTSVHEHIPLPGESAYTASKGGLGLLTKSMALELAEHRIRVVAVAPGEIATAMTGAQDADPDEIDRTGKIPLARPGHAREIANWIAFLASDEASYATGASYVVDGGLMLKAADQG
jgi:NAD(P)-dependent dehydrogenase (short-subunit alcohol dehydrogenase family)